MIKEIKSFVEYIDYIQDLAKYDFILYRWQDCDKPLLPRIARDAKLVKHEKRLFEEFQRKSHSFLNIKEKNEWEKLAIAQHHGIPTRLLDWTENPLIALWFACQNEEKNKENYGVVWIILAKEENTVYYTDWTSPFSLAWGEIKIYKPHQILSRITNQSGWFTVHTKSEGKDFVALENYPWYGASMNKIKIHKKLFKDFKIKLSKLGVNESTIFPDLDWMCRHITWSIKKDISDKK